MDQAPAPEEEGEIDEEDGADGEDGRRPDPPHPARERRGLVGSDPFGPRGPAHQAERLPDLVRRGVGTEAPVDLGLVPLGGQHEGRADEVVALGLVAPRHRPVELPHHVIDVREAALEVLEGPVAVAIEVVADFLHV